MDTLRELTHARWTVVAAALTRPQSPASRAYVTLLTIYWLVYPFAVAGTVLDVRPPFPMAWAASALLFLQASAVGTWAWARSGARRAALALAVVAGGGLSAELIGVATGFPFGRYHYTSVLSPLLPGRVPLAVVCAWVYVVFAALASAHLLLARFTTAGWQRREPGALAVIGLAALLALGLDLLLEPVATRVEGYWIWDVSGPYFGVPLSNFGAWAVLAALFAAVAMAIVRSRRAGRSPVAADPSRLGYTARPSQRGPASLYLAGVTMFGLINLSHGAWIAALVGVGLVGLVALSLRGATD